MKATHCFQRRKFVDENNYSEAHTFHQYTLVGIAAPDRDGIDIYRYFFHSTFKKGTEKNISLFFKGFVKLFVLKCLMERTPGLSFRREIENIVKEELFRLNKEGKEVGLLIDEAKTVGKALQQKYRNFFWKEKLTQQEIHSSFVQYAIKLSDIIHRQMAETINQLKENASQIMQEEYVPQKMTKIQAIRAISANFESINHIDIMRHVRKTSLLKDLNALRSHSSLILRIPLVQNNRFEKQSGLIKVRHLSQETQPIMILLSDMAIHRELDWRNRQYREVWKKLVHSIVSCCNKFHEQSDSYLPALTAEDVYFDQKKLKTVLTYDKLILDGIGLLEPDTKNIECNLALALTPTFGQEKCYLQQEPRQKWLLKRKYHVRRVQGAEKDDEVVHLLQNIHVWRIINLVFYMREGKHISQFFYQQYYRSQKFTIKDFSQARRRMYDEMKEGSISVANIFNIQQTYRNQQNEMTPFGFTLSEVRSIVGDNQQDSFIERLPVKRMQDYLLNRSQLFMEIYDIFLNDFFFRLFLNPKKYILLLLLSYFEEAHYLQTRRKVRSEDGIKLKQIVQKRKQRIGQMSDRIRNYYNSTEGTANSKYVKSKYETLINKKLWPIDELWSETLKKDDFVINQKERLKEMKEDMGNDVEEIQNIENSINNQEKYLKQNVEKMMKYSYNAILDFMEKEIKPDLNKNIQTIHDKKVGGEFWEDYVSYLNKKLPIMVTTILWLKYDNWLKFSCLLKNTLVEEGRVASRYKGIKNLKEVKYVQSKVLEIKNILEELKLKQKQ